MGGPGWVAAGRRGEDRSLLRAGVEAALFAVTVIAVAGWKMCWISTTLRSPLFAGWVVVSVLCSSA